MPHINRMPLLVAVVSCAAGALVACGGGDSPSPVEPVTIAVTGTNAVSSWNEVAMSTINVPPSATGSAEEQRPNSAVDLATVHVAIYDAVIAIAGTHRPYAITPAAPTDGASQEAAAAAAAYGVLLGLFPNRSAQYQPAYEAHLTAVPDGTARSKGVAVGAEVATRILALRAADGRSVAMAAYVPGTAPGQFRGTNPIGRPNAFIKPFALTSVSQFRAPGPPALTSAAYATDFNEVKSLGSLTGSTRTVEETEAARFHTQPPPTLWPINLRRFAMTNRSVAEHARLMAMVWVAQADAGNACFDSKYHYQTWRPASAVALADTDGNAATVADPAWVTVVATPNHPEYPAAHGCVGAATAEILRAYYGTNDVTFEFTSTITGTTRRYTSVSALLDEVVMSRILGGMHFRFSLVDGVALGRSVGTWITTHHFQPR